MCEIVLKLFSDKGRDHLPILLYKLPAPHPLEKISIDWTLLHAINLDFLRPLIQSVTATNILDELWRCLPDATLFMVNCSIGPKLPTSKLSQARQSDICSLLDCLQTVRSGCFFSCCSCFSVPNWIFFQLLSFRCRCSTADTGHLHRCISHRAQITD